LTSTRPAARSSAPSRRPLCGADQTEILVLHSHAPAGSRHARHLIHHAQRLLDVQDHGDGEHRVEAPIGERQPMPVGATKHEAATRCAA